MAEALETTFEVRGLEDTMRAFAQHIQMVKEAGYVHEELAETMRNLRAPIWSMRRDLMAMRTAWRMQHATMIEVWRGLRRISRVVGEVRQIFVGYQISMLRLERAQRDVQDATRDVAYYQDLYNQYLRDFGEDSPFTIDALQNLHDAQRAAEEATRQTAQAVQEMNWYWATAAVQLGIDIPSTLYFLGKDISIVTALIAEKGGLIPAIQGLISSLGGLGVIVPPFAVGLGLLAAAFWMASQPTEVQNKALKDLSDTMADFEEHGKWAIQNLKEQQEAFYEAQKSVEDYGGAVDDLFKRSPLPEMNIWLGRSIEKIDKLTRTMREGESQARRYGRALTVRNVNITQYNTLTGDLDVTRLAEESYRLLLRKLEAIW
jgi:hypothetical protein